MATDARTELKRLIARFQHANESLHRHPSGGKSCEYCELVGHFAVRTILDHPAETVALLTEAGVLAQVGYVWQTSQGVQWSGPEGIGHRSEQPVYRVSLPTKRDDTDG